MTTYEDENLVHPEEGGLDSMLDLLSTRRYGLTPAILAQGYRMALGSVEVRILATVLAKLARVSQALAVPA